MIKEVLIKAGENVLATLQVFFGKRDRTEEYLLRTGEPVYRFVEGTEENVIISSKGTILKRYPKACKCPLLGRKEYYEEVICKVNNSGYLQVGLGPNLNTKNIHRLVAETFLEREEGKNEVDHINQNKKDNRVENLRWVTHSENMKNLKGSNTRDSLHYINIEAKNLETEETLSFKSSKDLVPFAKEQKWGKGWGPRIYRILRKGGGPAYGYFWTGQSN